MTGAHWACAGRTPRPVWDLGAQWGSQALAPTPVLPGLTAQRLGGQATFTQEINYS